MKIYGYSLLFLLTGMSYAMEEEVKDKAGFLQKVGKLLTRRSSVDTSSGGVTSITRTSTSSSGTRGSTGNMRLTRSSDGTMSPRGVSFNLVVAARLDDNSHMTYKYDIDGKRVLISGDDEDGQDGGNDDIPSSSTIHFQVDPNGRKNPYFKNPRERTCKSAGTISAGNRNERLQADGQCPVGTSSTASTPMAQGAGRISDSKAQSQKAAASDSHVDYTSMFQDSEGFAYHVGCDDDDVVDPAIVALAAKSAATEKVAHGLDISGYTLDDLNTMKQLTGFYGDNDDGVYYD